MDLFSTQQIDTPIQLIYKRMVFYKNGVEAFSLE